MRGALLNVFFLLALPPPLMLFPLLPLVLLQLHLFPPRTRSSGNRRPPQARSTPFPATPSDAPSLRASSWAGPGRSWVALVHINLLEASTYRLELEPSGDQVFDQVCVVVLLPLLSPEVSLRPSSTLFPFLPRPVFFLWFSSGTRPRTTRIVSLSRGVRGRVAVGEGKTPACQRAAQAS